MVRLGLVVAAGGAGRRFGGDKVFVPVRGRALLFWTLARLRRIRDAGPTVLVLPADRVAAVREEWGAELAAAGVTAVVAGGARRQDSVRAGLEALPGDVDLVLVHDAVRPLFSVEAADRAVAAAAEGGAAIVAVPARDTLKTVDSELRIGGTVPRETTWHAETPQVVRRDWLAAAFARAEADGFAATDEASLVEHLGRPVAVVCGRPWNLKVTEADDVRVVEALLGAPAEEA